MGVAVTFDDDNATVDAVPGTQASCSIRVENTGMVVDSMLLDLLGEAAEWATVEPAQMNLLPGASGQARIVFSPPRVATLEPGEVPFGLRAMSMEDPDGSCIEEGVVRVGEFSDLSADLVPKSATGRRSARYRLVVENHGNRPEDLAVEAVDADVKLAFRTRPHAFTAAPGTATFVRLTAVPRKTFFKGPSKTLPFQVSAQPEQGDAAKVDGAMLEKQTLPEWLLPLLGIAVLLAGLLLALWFTVLRPVVHAANTAATSAQTAANSAKSAAKSAKNAANSASSAAKSHSAAPTPTGKPAALDVTLPEPTILSRTTELASVTGSFTKGTGALPPLVWTSSNSKIAKVSQTGVVTGVSPGSATITATTATKTSSTSASTGALVTPRNSHAPGNLATVLSAASSTSPSASGAAILSGSAKVNVVAAVAVSTTALPPAPVGKAFEVSLDASGGTGAFTWSITTGSLPAGLSVSPSSGMITGTATTLGTSRFTVHVADAGPPTQFATKVFTLTVVKALAVTTSSLPGGMVGTAYGQTLTATGGTPPYTWSVVPGTGSLPPGLTLDATTGAIAGTPTSAGVANFVIQVSDSSSPGQSVTQPLSIKVASPLTLTTLTLPEAVKGAVYSQSLTAIGGVQPYTWSVTSGSPPGGVTLNAASGTLSGTPAATGTSTFTVQVTDTSLPSLTATQRFTLTVEKPFVTTTSSLPQDVVGKAYSATLTAAGGTGPYVWTLEGTLPPGLTMSPAGVITGLPTATGLFPFTVQAVDSSSPPLSVTVPLSITVTSSLKVTAALAEAPIGVFYSQTISASGGSPPYTWSITAGSLPPGLGLSATTGVISGTPIALGTSSFTVTVTDPANVAPFTASFSTSISVVEPLSFGPPEFNIAETGRPYAVVTPEATGGSGTYTWSITSGALPLGMSLDPATGAIGGQPSGSPGPDYFTLTVADAKDPSLTFSQPESITVVAGLQVLENFAVPVATVDNPSFSEIPVTAVGGIKPYTYSFTSADEETALLEMDPGTGQLTGPVDEPCPAPTTSTSGGQVTITCPDQTYQESVTVTDAAGYATTLTVPITVHIPPLTFTPATSGGQVADSSGYNLAALGTISGGYPSFLEGSSGGYSVSTTRVSGNTPTNNGLPCESVVNGCSLGELVMNSSTGVITGTIAAVVLGQTWTFNVTLANVDQLNSGNSFNYSFQLTIKAGVGSSS